MFKQLFKTEETVQHYGNGPVAESRAGYIEQCSKQGFSEDLLRRLAATHLRVARDLSLDPPRCVSLAEVLSALDRLPGKPDPKNGGKGSPRWQSHRKHTIQWLGQAGLLESSAPDLQPCAAWIDDFESWLRGARGCSEETVRLYLRLVGEFLSRIPEADTITVADLDLALRDKSAQGVSKQTLRSYGTALRAFLGHAEKRGWCQPGLSEAVMMPRIPRQASLPPIPSAQEIERLLESAASDRPADLRDRAILLLLSGYGLRVGEVSALHLDDIDWERARLQIRRPKAGSHDLFPLSSTVGQALARYIREARPRRPCRNVFLTLKAPLSPLTPTAISSLVHRRMQRIGVTGKRRGAHALRHAFARDLLAKGFAMHEIGECLGHRSPESTAYYAKVDLAALRAVADIDLEGLA